MALAKVWGFVI